MPDPETNKPGEGSDGDHGPAGVNAHESAAEESSPPVGETDPSEAASEANPSQAEGVHEAPSEAETADGLSAFAEDVVSGLEHAGFDAGENEAFHESSGEPAGASDAFFADWGAFGESGQAEDPAQQQAENFIHLETPAPSLQALSRMGGLAGSAETGGTPASRAGKHEELADAVQSALFSIYGETAHQPAGPDYTDAAPEDGPPSSMSWSKGLKTDYTPPSGDGLSPQDVILNYFDYNPGSKGSGQGYASSGHGRASANGSEDPLPNFARGRPEPAAPQQRSWSAQDYPAYRPERAPAETKTPQYDGPPSYSYPVPAMTPAASRPGGRTGHESSRLLGAAAIGLMGGIAIAASLAAFLIYGPRPASIEIPGIGNLRLDKDEQGYGQIAPQEASRDLQRSTVKSAPEFSSEMLAGDMTATPGQPAPLSISIRPQPSERTLVSIGGLPEGGRLNAGVDTGGGNWLLPPRRLNGLAINLPAGAPDFIPIQVQLLDSNARTPLSAKTEFVIRVKSANAAAGAQFPAAGTGALAQKPAQSQSAALSFNTQTLPQPQESPSASRTSGIPTAFSPGGAIIQAAPADVNFKTQTVTAPSSSPVQATLTPGAAPAGQEQLASRRANPRPEVEDLIREGNKRMREGDILEAREFYQKAVVFGDPEAALAMGRSYDPIYFARIDKKNAEPDAAKAFDWYRKAMDAGAAQTGKVRIDNLKHFLNE